MELALMNSRVWEVYGCRRRRGETVGAVAEEELAAERLGRKR